ncbi:UTP--glucose-1-phosphate uridylyltransferase GalU [Gallaecimonas sp. GXIMD4217]|uniref:UTP--glucose-1-phosphate uridylyltransferase GalU n=1 Tax=Gallaecimonas sp. GXIMD4217 TaxID=3131927 RepID=UPI00311B39AD
MKAVIPVAGLGTRMLPASKAIPKEMLPVVDKPLIQFVVDECVAAGIKEIVLVTHSSKNAIENHFDKSFELESMLEKRVKRQLLEEVKTICPDGVTIMHVRQGEAKGLGHAIMCAQPLVGDSPFCVLLPDVLVDDCAANPFRDNLAEMMMRFNEKGISQVMVEAVPQEEVNNYGVVDINGGDIVPGQSVAMAKIVEKPNLADAPSNMAVVGRYVFSRDIWPLFPKTPVGAGGEIQLTDTIAMLMERQPVEAYRIKGYSHDCGDKLGYMKTFVTYGTRHPKLASKFSNFLKSLEL